VARFAVTRCAASSSTQATGDGYCHAWDLHMPCGRALRSRAAEPPITVACRRDCPVDVAKHNRRRLPQHEW